MRIMSADALAKIAIKTGTEPINTVEIDWPILPPGSDSLVDATTIYSDRNIEGVSIEAFVLEIGNIDEIVKLSDKATAAQVSITLDDTSGLIKGRMDRFDIQKRPVRIYQFFDGLNYKNDKFLIFDGEIVTPIIWNERERKITFEAITRTRAVEVGFAPEEGQFKNVGPETADKVWPLCFGSPIHVPAVLSEIALVGTLMTRMGFPDPTLKYKKELLQYRKEQYQSALDHYKNLLEKNNTKSRPASAIQESYAHHIVAYDGLKQVIEDNTLELEKLNRQLDELNQEWTDPMELQTRSVIEGRFKAVRTGRNKCRAILKGLYAQKRQFEQAEKGFKIEIENAKFYTNLAERVKKKIDRIKKDMVKIDKELSIAVQAIAYQAANLNSRTALVWDGTKFPQDVQKRYDINNAIFQATMSDKTLSIQGIVAKYKNIDIGDRLNESPDLFWIAPSLLDGDDHKMFRDEHGKGKLVDLSNMYVRALMKDGSYRILRVTNQKNEDGQCKIDLISKVQSKAVSRREINYDTEALDKEAFDEGLNRLLSGGETQSQIAEIANNIPKDICPKIWDILHGNRIVQYIELLPGSRTGKFVTDFAQSTFQLIYGDEEITDEIYFNDPPITIKNKITKSIIQLPANSITVTEVSTCNDVNGVTGFKKLKIQFNSGLMKPFRIYRSNLLKDPLELNTDSVVISKDPTTVVTATLGIERELLKKPNMEVFFSGDVMIFLNGRVIPIKAADLANLDGATLQSYLEETPRGDTDDPDESVYPITNPGEIECTGGPLKTSNITITYNVDFKPILIDTSGLGVGKNGGEISLPIKLGPMSLEEDTGKYYQRLYFDRSKLLNPDSPMTLSGKFILNFGPQRHVFTLDVDRDGENITRNMIADNSIATNSNFLAVGGPLSVADIKIYQQDPDYAVSMIGIQAIGKGLGKEAAFELEDFKSEFYPIKPSLSLMVKYNGQGASEYTDTERLKKLQEAIDKNINSPAVNRFRDQVLNSIKEYRDDIQDLRDEAMDGAGGGAVLGGLLDQYFKDIVEYQRNLSILADVANKVGDSAFNLEEVYRLISNDERKMLYELEILGYVEWKLKLKEKKDPDDDDEDSQYEFTAKDIAEIMEASPVILQSWLDYLDLKPKPDKIRTHKTWRMKEISLIPNNTAPFVGEIGDRVTIEDEYQEKYICNCLPSQIKAVYAWKYVNGIKRMVPLSDQMYVKNENDETYGEMMTVTSVTLRRPLKTYDKNWEDGLYVSLISSVGPNVCDILTYLTRQYTSCDVDPTTFGVVRTYQENYPCNFALLEKVDAFNLLEDIAWQSRSKIWIKEQVVYIMYLPKEPNPVAVLNNSNIEEGSLQLTYSPTEDIFTKLTALWRPDYSKDKEWRITVRRNLWRYGENSEERRFFIYNIEDLVYKSLTFWMIRWSNTFKIVQCRVFLDNLILETNDYVTFAAGNPFANGSISGLIINSEYDSVANSIDLSVWLPVLSGTMTKYDFAMPADLHATRKFPDPPDIKNGDAGNPYGVTIPTGNYLDPLDPEFDVLRPKDFGKEDIGDLDDLLPKNPISELDEISYNLDPEDKVSDMTRFLYSYVDIDNEPYNLEERALQLQAQTTEVRSNIQEEIFVTYGRVVREADTVNDDPPADGDPGLNTTTTFYAVELSSGKIINAREFRPSRTPVPYNQTVIVTRDSFTKDYVFQVPSANGAKDFTGVKN